MLKLFDEEINEIRKELVEDKRQHYRGLPRYAGRAMGAVLKQRRLRTMLKVSHIF